MIFYLVNLMGFIFSTMYCYTCNKMRKHPEIWRPLYVETFKKVPRARSTKKRLINDISQ